ncbi:hypothetical protein GCM10012280_65670 [Wenjunlia tyrosinilytica]|uniref:Uncharacterized protein n=1 Tax=Wenjunlia tyrosinilytica TaxID=1544741 RepID=A0A917ZYX2_9ACTN|nr:hypothetical protein GCM10012280_65670 [Wenjunlia tyrosinilytica]
MSNRAGSHAVGSQPGLLCGLSAMGVGLQTVPLMRLVPAGTAVLAPPVEPVVRSQKVSPYRQVLVWPAPTTWSVGCEMTEPTPLERGGRQILGLPS